MLNPSVTRQGRSLRSRLRSAEQEKTGEALLVPTWRRSASFAGGVLALLLAGWGEAVVESGNTTPLSLLLYSVAIALFVVSGWFLRPATVDLPSPTAAVDLPTRERRMVPWSILGVGMALALCLDIIALGMLHADLKSQPGAYLWLLSALVLLIAGVMVSRKQGWSPRWGGVVWPASGRRMRLLMVLALATIMALAVAARLLWLDKVPFGINADEGDRGAVSIQIIHGDNTSSIFDAGWYYISILYFWMLAGVMKVAGVGWVGARVFGALASIVSVGVVTWIGIRNFGLRVGLLAGAILSTLAVSLQFARETSEAGPTATLWAISVALFLEAARGGRSWAWVGSGLAGGFSIYFYPSGRLWAALAVIWGLYLLLHGLGNRRWGIVRGLALSAVAAIIVMGPFFVHAFQGGFDLNHNLALTQRAQETSIFTAGNATRLSYYKPDWSMSRLLTEQTLRAVGIVNQFSDEGGFWPTDRPIMSGMLAVLTLLGLGWCCLRWRDPRSVMLGIWYWVGLSGVIVTVETPNLQRMATAVPVLALFPALALDSMVRRAEGLVDPARIRQRRSVAWAMSAVAVGVALLMMSGQWNYYFNDYARADRWPQPSNLGAAVNSQGTGALVLTLGRQHHMVNSGWVRLMAPETPKAGLPDPGGSLPISIPPGTDLKLPDKPNLVFLIYPKQAAYLPLLSELYPLGATKPYTHPSEGLMFTTYSITNSQWAATQGAMSEPAGKPAVRVGTLGAVPAGWSLYPSPMRWTAGLRVPRYWNYSFKIGPGPAKLTIDANDVLTIPAGAATMTATVALARGYHSILYDGTLLKPGEPALFQWAPSTVVSGTVTPGEWSTPRSDELDIRQQKPQGLYGVITMNEKPEQHIVDATLATCCLGGVVHAEGHDYTAHWTGTLAAPSTGVYSMTLFAQGSISLAIDGKPLFQSDKGSDNPTGAEVSLTKGPHTVDIMFKVADPSPGGIEWIWMPPGGVTSVVPPSALSPVSPGGSISLNPVPTNLLGKNEQQPTDAPFEIDK
ncbi:MAG: glycosyltransferase family 39 protein [Chloroflexota bacterium]|nr:glycosyltransferase family 39 protein [Chloroflexota bacterium]